MLASRHLLSRTAIILTLGLGMSACSSGETFEPGLSEVAPLGNSDSGDAGKAMHHEPESVGLGLAFFNGEWNQDLSPFPNPERPTALHVVDGHPRYLQELILIARLPTTLEQGLDPLLESGDFSGLNWNGAAQVSEDWRLEVSGFTWQHQRFFRDAKWMEKNSEFKVIIRDAHGDKLDEQTIHAGRDDRWKNEDDMFERRFLARVVSSNCVAENDCANLEATHYAEALVQLKTALHPEKTFRIPDRAASLEVKWSAYPGHSWEVPIVHDDAETNGYGLGIKLSEVNPPSRGYYLPGETVAIRIEHTDGDGNRLFDEGGLPTYGDMLNRRPAAQGMRYLTFNDEPMLYWAHKDPQAAMQTFLAGPVQQMTQIGTVPITPQSAFLDEIPIADQEVDGWTGLTQETPHTPILFSCLFDPSSPLCDAPISDVFSYTLPDNADSGTYLLGTKARREFGGEVIQKGATIEVQVGQTQHTHFPPFHVAGMNNQCASCHVGRAALPVAAHGFPDTNKVGPQCLGCHTAGYYFEPDADIETRLLYLHAQSRRLDPPH